MKIFDNIEVLGITKVVFDFGEDGEVCYERSFYDVLRVSLKLKDDEGVIRSKNNVVVWLSFENGDRDKPRYHCMRTDEKMCNSVRAICYDSRFNVKFFKDTVYITPITVIEYYKQRKKEEKGRKVLVNEA